MSLQTSRLSFSELPVFLKVPHSWSQSSFEKRFWALFCGLFVLSSLTDSLSCSSGAGAGAGDSGILLFEWQPSLGFPDSSVGKESACNAEDPGLIPGLGRSAGEGIGYPLQNSWTSPAAQMVKNPPAMQETWVQPLGWEDPLEKGKATHSSILAWRISWTVYSMGLPRVR